MHPTLKFITWSQVTIFTLYILHTTYGRTDININRSTNS